METTPIMTEEYIAVKAIKGARNSLSLKMYTNY